VTTNDRQLARGSRRLAAARKTRSADASSGRPTAGVALAALVVGVLGAVAVLWWDQIQTPTTSDLQRTKNDLQRTKKDVTQLKRDIATLQTRVALVERSKGR
jgi:uncharacterized protein YlxW (UPF0749 family)